MEKKMTQKKKNVDRAAVIFMVILIALMPFLWKFPKIPTLFITVAIYGLILFLVRKFTKENSS